MREWGGGGEGKGRGRGDRMTSHPERKLSKSPTSVPTSVFI